MPGSELNAEQANEKINDLWSRSQSLARQITVIRQNLSELIAEFDRLRADLYQAYLKTGEHLHALKSKGDANDDKQ